RSFYCGGSVGPAAKKEKPCRAVHPLVEETESGGRGQVLARRELDDCKCIRREPAGRLERCQRRSGDAAAVRRVEKRQRVRRRCAWWAGGVAGDDPRTRIFPERRDVPAK